MSITIDTRSKKVNIIADYLKIVQSKLINLNLERGLKIFRLSEFHINQLKRKTCFEKNTYVYISLIKRCCSPFEHYKYEIVFGDLRNFIYLMFLTKIIVLFLLSIFKFKTNSEIVIFPWWETF